MFSEFIVLGLTFDPLIHSEPIFAVLQASSWSFIFLFISSRFAFPALLVKYFVFFSIIYFVSFVKDAVHSHGFISLLLLFCYIHLHFQQLHCLDDCNAHSLPCRFVLCFFLPDFLKLLIVWLYSATIVKIFVLCSLKIHIMPMRFTNCRLFLPVIFITYIDSFNSSTYTFYFHFQPFRFLSSVLYSFLYIGLCLFRRFILKVFYSFIGNGVNGNCSLISSFSLLYRNAVFLHNFISRIYIFMIAQEIFVGKCLVLCKRIGFIT